MATIRVIENFGLRIKIVWSVDIFVSLQFCCKFGFNAWSYRSFNFALTQKNQMDFIFRFEVLVWLFNFKVRGQNISEAFFLGMIFISPKKITKKLSYLLP